LPINLHAMTSGAPDYTLDSLFLNFLDQTIGWSEELNIYLILDNHSFDPAVSTSPDIVNIGRKQNNYGCQNLPEPGFHGIKD
jgi:endoglucanase